jgi:hypothetical protein
MSDRKSGYQLSPYIQMKTENQTDLLALGENIHSSVPRHQSSDQIGVVLNEAVGCQISCI